MTEPKTPEGLEVENKWLHRIIKVCAVIITALLENKIQIVKTILEALQ